MKNRRIIKVEQRRPGLADCVRCKIPGSARSRHSDFDKAQAPKAIPRGGLAHVPTTPLDLLRQARARYSQGELATLLDVDVRTVRRWEVRENDPPPYLADAIRQRILPLMTASTDEHPFTFIDLFAGIGGIRLGFEAHGGHCMFTSEWNAFAQKTYLANFPLDNTHIFAGDITTIDAADIPDHKEVARIMIPHIMVLVSDHPHGEAHGK